MFQVLPGFVWKALGQQYFFSVFFFWSDNQKVWEWGCCQSVRLEVLEALIFVLLHAASRTFTSTAPFHDMIFSII